MASKWKALSKTMQEVRIHMCQTGASSAGVREFLQKNYAAIKKDNPLLPFLVREASGTEPKLYARYDYGIERSVSLKDLKTADIGVQLEALSKLGEAMPKA